MRFKAVSYLNPEITIPIHYNTFSCYPTKSSNIRRASSWRESIKPRRHSTWLRRKLWRRADRAKHIEEELPIGDRISVHEALPKKF